MVPEKLLLNANVMKALEFSKSTYFDTFFYVFLIGNEQKFT